MCFQSNEHLKIMFLNRSQFQCEGLFLMSTNQELQVSQAEYRHNTAHVLGIFENSPGRLAGKSAYLLISFNLSSSHSKRQIYMSNDLYMLVKVSQIMYSKFSHQPALDGFFFVSFLICHLEHLDKTFLSTFDEILKIITEVYSYNPNT
ncbi:CLUMA_CG018321, isoform A [Clunio marinus]|uniref:CLUMA_CG018321, isoform A n=1 Tax=Clunio marinus TaxID=568069 RepID=A0A1J1IZH9_9DIPT|nr:CLUMA_CG018321, isoform A [Clunio marinus]